MHVCLKYTFFCLFDLQLSSTSESDLEMKVLLYSLLAADGSANSQQVRMYKVLLWALHVL